MIKKNELHAIKVHTGKDEVGEKIESLLKTVKASSEVRRQKLPSPNVNIIRLLESALSNARKGDITAISFVAVHSNFKVSNHSAGKTEDALDAINGGIVSQLFDLNLRR